MLRKKQARHLERKRDMSVAYGPCANGMNQQDPCLQEPAHKHCDFAEIIPKELIHRSAMNDLLSTGSPASGEPRGEWYP